jgi:hypothetical protein
MRAGAAAVALAACPTPEAPKADNPTFAAPVSAFVDIDNDGDFEPFVEDGAGDLWFYENTDLPADSSPR